MLELTLRNGMYFIGDKRVNRLADVDRFSVFQTIGDVHRPSDKGGAKTNISVYFLNDAMDIVFCVNANSEFEHGFISIDSEVVAT